MTIYLNNFKHGYSNSSYLKSSGKLTAFYSTTAFILFCSYTNLRILPEFLPINGRLLPYLFTLNLLSGISFTPIILILST